MGGTLENLEGLLESLQRFDEVRALLRKGASARLVGKTHWDGYSFNYITPDERVLPVTPPVTAPATAPATISLADEIADALGMERT